MKGIDEEQVEIAVAWAKGEISLVKASMLLNLNNPYPTLARALKVYFQWKKIAAHKKIDLKF